MHYYKLSLTALTTLILTISSTTATFPGLFQASQVLAQTANSQQAEARRLEKQGFEYLEKKQITNARESWQKALTLYKEIKNREKESFLLLLIGMTSNNSTTAIDYLQQALTITQQLPKRDNELAILQLLAKNYEQVKNYDKALDFSQQALVVARAKNDYESEKSLLINIAKIYENNFQDYDKAIEYYQQALVKARAANDQKTERILLVHLAALYEKMPNPR